MAIKPYKKSTSSESDQSASKLTKKQVASNKKAYAKQTKKGK